MNQTLMPREVHYDGEFIWIANEDLVFDVAFWKYEEGNTVNFVGRPQVLRSQEVVGRGTSMMMVPSP